MKLLLGLGVAALLLVSLNLVKVKLNQESFALEEILDWEDLQDSMLEQLGSEQDEQFSQDSEEEDSALGNDKIKEKTITFVALDILRVLKIFQGPNITVAGQTCQTDCGKGFNLSQIESSRKGKKTFVTFSGPFKNKCKKHLKCPFVYNAKNSTDNAFFLYNLTATYALAEVTYQGAVFNVDIVCPVQVGISHGFRSYPIALNRTVPYDERSPKGECSLCSIKVHSGKFIKIDVSQLPIRFWTCKHGKSTVALHFNQVKKIL